MAPIERQDRRLSIGVLVDVWVVLVRELQVSDFRQFTEILGTRSARNRPVRTLIFQTLQLLIRLSDNNINGTIR